MTERPNDADLHRLLDGELDASSRLRLEERMRRSPAMRAEFDALVSLDRTLRAALGPSAEDTRSVGAVGARAAEAVRARRDGRPAARLVIDAPRGRLRRARLVAGIAAALLVTVGLHALVATWLANGEDGATAEDPSVIAALRKENDALRARLLDFDRAAPTLAERGSPFSPPMPATEPATAAADPSVPAPPPPAETADERDAVRTAFARLLDEARRNGGRLDRRALALLFARLEKLGASLTDDDFREFQALFHQQPDPSPGQLAVAQALSRFFNHLDGARTFAFQQLDADLAKMQQQPGYVGDRHLRRAWTEALAYGRQDPRSASYLERVGMTDRDWINRRNAMAGLVRQGTRESVVALAQIAANETNPLLKYEAVSYLSSILDADPTLVQSSAELATPLVELATGDIGANGDYSDAMYWALMILSKLNVDITALHAAFMRQNQNTTGGDPRLATPDGSPIERP